jgi:superfamily I DNA/RNA helicase
LREFHEEAGLPKNFKILSELEKLVFLKSKMREVTAINESIDLEWIASRIGYAKNTGITPSQYPEDAEKGLLVQRSFQLYEKALQKSSALDFDDLLIRSLHLLNNNENVLKKLRTRYQFISVDEYQDTNRIQFETVKLLAAPRNNICAVGDDDQGIYSWRGADISNILSFNSAFPGTVKIKLEKNYRSTSTILSAANAVIEKNTKRTVKTMWSDNGNGEPIEHYQAEDEQDEAEWLVKTIGNLQKDKVCSFKDAAVLCRTNEMSRIFEVEFQRMKIPYKIPGSGGFYERKEVKDLFGYLMFIANPLDELSLSRILRVPSWHISKETMKTLESSAGARKCSLWEVFCNPGNLNVPEGQKENIGKFAGFIKKFIVLFGKGGLINPYREMVTDLKYREYLNDLYADRKEEAQKRLAVVNELEHSIELFCKGRKKVNLAMFLHDILIMLNEKEEDDKRDAVTITTLHSSKGMEYPVVFLPGLDDDVMPSKRSVNEGNIEEERRLFYVGMTRAQKRLYLSWPASRFLYNKHRPVKYCRFISDIPENLLAAPIGKRESETREAALADFFKEMQEKLKTGFKEGSQAAS